jgi:hypothetical protein
MTPGTDPDLVSRLADQLAAGELGETMRLFAANGVAPPTVEWEPPLDRTESKQLDFLIRYWSGARDGRTVPTPDRIDPVGLQPVLGRLLVCEPMDGATDFRIRLYGSGLALEMGRDLTGSRISEVQPGSHVTTFFLACYRAVALRGAPLYTRHQPSTASFASDIKRLLLPFGAAGEVARILVGVDAAMKRPLGRPSWQRRR